MIFYCALHPRNIILLHAKAAPAHDPMRRPINDSARQP
jgi:hypothetical protein